MCISQEELVRHPKRPLDLRLKRHFHFRPFKYHYADFVSFSMFPQTIKKQLKVHFIKYLIDFSWRISSFIMRAKRYGASNVQKITTRIMLYKGPAIRDKRDKMRDYLKSFKK